jgi:hypothetical protein
MALGPGRYDAIATLAREQIGDGAGVALIVFHPDPTKCGFAVQLPHRELLLFLPAMMRELADELERDVRADAADA